MRCEEGDEGRGEGRSQVTLRASCVLTTDRGRQRAVPVFNRKSHYTPIHIEESNLISCPVEEW